MGWMDFLKRLKNKLSVTPDEEEQVLREILGIRKDTKRKLMSEVTYFTCLKMLSETMGKLPLKYYQDTKNGRIRASPSEMSYLLTVRPNSIMTPSTLWSTTEMNCQHYGNGYIWIQWQYLAETYGGRVVPRSLWPLQSSQVEVIMDNAGVFGESGKCYYVYNDPRTGEQYIFEEHEIMHFKTWYSLDGFLGEPVRNILKYTIDGAAESQTFMNNLYKQGLTASMVMQYSDNLDEERIKKLKKKFGDQLTGSKNAG
jgi:HK97 family phage portal protein